MIVATNEKRRQETEILETDFGRLSKEESTEPTQSWAAIEYCFSSSQELKHSPPHWEFRKKTY